MEKNIFLTRIGRCLHARLKCEHQIFFLKFPRANHLFCIYDGIHLSCGYVLYYIAHKRCWQKIQVIQLDNWCRCHGKAIRLTVFSPSALKCHKKDCFAVATWNFIRKFVLSSDSYKWSAFIRTKQKLFWHAHYNKFAQLDCIPRLSVYESFLFESL